MADVDDTSRNRVNFDSRPHLLFDIPRQHHVFLYIIHHGEAVGDRKAVAPILYLCTVSAVVALI